MLSYPILQVIIAALLLATQLGILLIFSKNFRTLKKIYYSNNRNMLVRQLQNEKIREARHYITNELCNKNYANDEWDFYDTVTASSVCGAYGNIGAYLNKGKIRVIDIISYKQSILECYNVLKPYMQNRSNDQGQTYWIDFEMLAMRLKNTKTKLDHKSL